MQMHELLPQPVTGLSQKGKRLWGLALHLLWLPLGQLWAAKDLGRSLTGLLGSASSLGHGRMALTLTVGTDSLAPLSSLPFHTQRLLWNRG